MTTAIAAQFKSSEFNELKKLEGYWMMPSENGRLVEEWKIVNENTLKGRGYELINTDTAYGETIQLNFIDGNITYTVTVFDQNDGKPVTFRLVSAKKGKFTFENKAHDFPRQIIYAPEGDKLNVTLTGKENKEVVMQFVRMED